MKDTKNFSEIPKSKWKSNVKNQTKVFHNHDFLIQVFEEFGNIRLTISRTEFSVKYGKPIWRDKILWDEILEIKQALEYDDFWGVECYPPKEYFVNDANMRHIFLFKEKPSWCWGKKKQD